MACPTTPRRTSFRGSRRRTRPTSKPRLAASSIPLPTRTRPPWRRQPRPTPRRQMRRPAALYLQQRTKRAPQTTIWATGRLRPARWRPMSAQTSRLAFRARSLGLQTRCRTLRKNTASPGRAPISRSRRNRSRLRSASRPKPARLDKRRKRCWRWRLATSFKEPKSFGPWRVSRAPW